MNESLRFSRLAKAGTLALAMAAPMAMAGHLNTVLRAELDAREEVNADGPGMRAGDPGGRAEAYVFGIDGNPDVLCYVLVNVRGIGELEQAPGNGRAAHIHLGERGANGPVVANLAWPQGGQAGDCLNPATQPERFPTGGQIVQEVLRHPQRYYVNIHNAEHPGGAIRGQLGDTAQGRLSQR